MHFTKLIMFSAFFAFPNSSKNNLNAGEKEENASTTSLGKEKEKESENGAKEEDLPPLEEY